MGPHLAVIVGPFELDIASGSPVTFEVYLSHIEGNAKSAFEALA
jgi:hypothetical protein